MTGGDDGCLAVSDLQETSRASLFPPDKNAVGRSGSRRPKGSTRQNKAVNPVWSVPNKPWAGALAGRAIPAGPENSIQSRWTAILDGAGIHGADATGSLGSATSPGCIRMAIPGVEELYDQVPVRTVVYIG
jgi:lipoprotein-anchoring transpeptidase ErfK/SrfK